MSGSGESRGLGLALKARVGRLLVQGSLLGRGIRPTGLARVWDYTDDCAGIQRHLPSDPRQAPKHVMPGLAAKPWHDPRELEWIPELEAAAGTIRGQVMSSDGASAFRDDAGELVAAPWQVHFLRCLGEDLDPRAFPAAAAAVVAARRPASTGHAYLARLDPGSEVAPWNGPTNTRLRVCLPIEAPPDASDFGLEVAGESKAVRQGRCLVFDDSFRHRVWNHTDRALVVLVVDVWHPDISDHEAVGLETFMRLSPLSVQYRRAVRAGLARQQ